jgi:hypothetical protein
LLDVSLDLTYPLIIALLFAAVALIVALLVMALRRKQPEPKALPAEWNVTARPVFSGDERRVYRLLREALPHHIVLSKLPLVRFCQPIDVQEVRYWYDLLGTINVTFAVCAPNGRVLAAIDLDTDRANSRRVLQIKQSVLGACRVRYLRCPVDHLPSVAELQLLVPHATAASRGPLPAPSVAQTPLAPSDSAAADGSPGRRRSRATLWQDSSFFQDSFFGADARDSAASEFGNLTDVSVTNLSPQRPAGEQRVGNGTTGA